MVFLTTHYNRSRKESWKEPPISYLPLLSLLAKPSQSPSLANDTLLGLRTLSAHLPGDQKSNYSDIIELSALPFQSSGQGPSSQSMYFSRHSSTFLEHILFLIQSTRSFVCTFDYTLNVQCSQPIASHYSNLV